MIGDNSDTGKIITLDEALFQHDEQGNQIWCAKTKETASNKLSIDVMKIRKSHNRNIY